LKDLYNLFVLSLLPHIFYLFSRSVQWLARSFGTNTRTSCYFSIDFFLFFREKTENRGAGGQTIIKPNKLEEIKECLQEAKTQIRNLEEQIAFLESK